MDVWYLDQCGDWTLNLKRIFLRDKGKGIYQVTATGAILGRESI